MGVAGELFIELLGLEPGLQLLGGGAVLPLLAAGAAVEQHPAGELVAALAARGQEVEQSAPEVGEAQGFVQLILVGAELIEQFSSTRLWLRWPMAIGEKPSSSGPRGEPGLGFAGLGGRCGWVGRGHRGGSWRWDGCGRWGGVRHRAGGSRVVVHVYPGSSKAASEPRLKLLFGRRGKPVIKPRLMPLRVAQAVALQLQARRVGTVSVL